MVILVVCVLRQPAVDVAALVGFGGAGMTLSFGAAEEVVDNAPRHVDSDH